jgi:hypothetical protein
MSHAVPLRVDIPSDCMPIISQLFPLGQSKASTEKPSNPKDAVGIGKVPMSTVPSAVLAEVGLAMFEGARKYSRHNYRVAGVRSSVYYDAAMRHLMSFWEGEDTDPDSGLCHLTKAIASIVVWRDAMMQAKLEDDRPPKTPTGWLVKLNELAKGILERYPDGKPAYTELNKGQG